MRPLLTIMLAFVSFAANGQYYWSESFDNPASPYRSKFHIDTTNYHHNIWQIGRPHKTTFDSLSVFSPPNVIVTDTANTYPPDDTSVFIIAHRFNHTPRFSLNFWYKLDIDSLAITKIEISGDSGLNWIDPMKEDTTYMFYWGIKPRLDTSTSTWQNFQLNMERWALAIPGGADTFPHYRTSDTILFRFTFISDTDTSVHRDGWMMDNFSISNAFMEGSVKNVIDESLIDIYPVPSSGVVYYALHGQKPENNELVIYNMLGQQVYKEWNIRSSGYIDLDLPNGNYMLKYSKHGVNTVKKMEICR